MADWVDDLNGAVDEFGQSVVARRLGCSPATISQLRTRQYPAATGKWQKRFEAAYGAGGVECPVLGEITREACGGHRRRPFAATNPMRVKLFHACRKCVNNPDRETP